VVDGPIEVFMERASALVADRGLGRATYEAIGAQLSALAEQTDDLDEDRLGGLHGSASATIVGRHADGSVLMLARFPSESATRIHNHNSWGVVCVVRGRDLYQRCGASRPHPAGARNPGADTRPGKTPDLAKPTGASCPSRDRIGSMTDR
jgi:hypothetical protein